MTISSKVAHLKQNSNGQQTSGADHMINMISRSCLMSNGVIRACRSAAMRNRAATIGHRPIVRFFNLASSDPSRNRSLETHPSSFNRAASIWQRLEIGITTSGRSHPSRPAQQVIDPHRKASIRQQLRPCCPTHQNGDPTEQREQPQFRS
ncbi:hypothetical protein ACLOJK_007722 [Asimina triloba]